MKKTNEIPEELLEIMRYLGFTFSQSISDNSEDGEDLYHDLIVLYLENKDKKPNYTLNHWFIYFKSRLIDKYRRAGLYRKILDTIQLEGK